jgi:hypothetical protein
MRWTVSRRELSDYARPSGVSGARLSGAAGFPIHEIETVFAGRVYDDKVIGAVTVGSPFLPLPVAPKTHTPVRASASRKRCPFPPIPQHRLRVEIRQVVRGIWRHAKFCWQRAKFGNAKAK